MQYEMTRYIVYLYLGTCMYGVAIIAGITYFV